MTGVAPEFAVAVVASCCGALKVNKVELRTGARRNGRRVDEGVWADISLSYVELAVSAIESHVELRSSTLISAWMALRYRCLVRAVTGLKNHALAKLNAKSSQQFLGRFKAAANCAISLPDFCPSRLPLLFRAFRIIKADVVRRSISSCSKPGKWVIVCIRRHISKAVQVDIIAP